MTCRFIFHVEILRISHVKCIEGLGKRIRPHRYHYEMYMISHETIRPYLHCMLLTIMSDQFQILNIVFGSFKDCLAIVAPLSDMMRETNCYRASYSRHAKI